MKLGEHSPFSLLLPLTAVCLATSAGVAVAQSPAASTIDGVLAENRFALETIEAPSDLNGLDELITGLMDEWKVPGLAIAVIDDGEIVLSKGYGYADLEEERPVTDRTLFAIGSVTKSFTVTLLGMLVDEGKLDWDEPVITYLTDFRLYDDYASDHMTPRDLVAHRSGLPRHDLMWYGADFTRREMYERLRYLKPSEPFRYVYQYQNLMFMTAGYLAGQVAGTTWEELIRRRLFEPLGMSRSNFSVSELETSDDAALPHVKSDEELRRVPYRNIDQIGPAGSINSSVEEMIRYVQFHIEGGKHGDQQLLSEENAREMQRPQMVIPGSIRYEEVGHDAYGLGLGVGYYRGHKVVSHGGGIDGFISLLSFMPREKIGMIILTNMSGQNPVPTIVSRRVYDERLGLEPVDWAARIRERVEEAEASERQEEGATDRVQDTTPSHPLADYAGKYEHPGYGAVQVESTDSTLRITFHGESTEFRHYHYDVFEARDDPLDMVADDLRIQFFGDRRGRVARLAAPLEPAVDDIVFTRVPDAEMRSRAFLERFTGAYEFQGTTMRVALRGDDTLTLTVPGQPTYELSPTQGMTFDIADLSGYSVEFRADDSGAVTEMVLHQPNGTFVTKRK